MINQDNVERLIKRLDAGRVIWLTSSQKGVEFMVDKSLMGFYRMTIYYCGQRTTKEQIYSSKVDMALELSKYNETEINLKSEYELIEVDFINKTRVA
jgi:hypothetical protein